MAMAQESRRKDEKRAFGILQTRLGILTQPSRFWCLRSMHNIVECCFILHIMVVRERVENEEEAYAESDSNVTVGECNLMWNWSTSNGDHETIYNSIAELCGVARFTNDESEQLGTKKLVTDHLWNARGNYSV